MDTANKYRSDIDGLRAIAVLSVVGFHAFPRFFKGGFVGVDIFFVISGYLISTIILNNLKDDTFSFFEFYSRRIKRIFPSLIVVLIACYVFGYFALFASEYMLLGKHVAGAAGFVSNFIFWNESGYFDTAAEAKPLLHLWSLSVEEQFYIIYPLLLYLASKIRFHLFKLILIIFVFSFILNIIKTKFDITEAFYSPYTRAWELMLGGILAYTKSFGWQKIFTEVLMSMKAYVNPYIYKIMPILSKVSFKNIESFIGLFLIMISVFLLNKSKAFPGWYALLPTLGAYLMILAGSTAWMNRHLLSNRVVVWVGLISYPLYLWHWPLLSFARIVESENPNIVIRGIAILCSIILAWLSFEFIEKPIRFQRGHNMLKVVMLCLLMAIVGYIGYYTYKHNGLESRTAVKNFYANNKELIRTVPRDDKCKFYIQKNNPLFDYCRYNDIGGDETVALIGDSHAHTAFPGLSELMAKSKKNLVLFANSSCPPLIGAVTGKNHREMVECKARVDELIKTLISKQEIKTVFMATRGQVYLSGKEFGVAASSIDSNIIRSDKGLDVGSSEVFFTSLQNTIDVLTKAGKRVFYILENPEIGINPESCIYRPFRMTRKKDCSIKLDLVKERQLEYLKIISLVKGLAVIDTFDNFCPNGICQVFHNDIILYVDGNHLSVEGSRLLARAIQDFLSNNANSDG